MRIISDFVDYYDNIQSLGQDQSLLYIRKKEEIKSPFHKLHYGFVIIGFCGKLYPAYKVSNYHKDYITKYSGEWIHKWCYSIDDVIEFNEQHDQKLIKNNHLYIKQSFNNYRQMSSYMKLETLFEKYPIFVTNNYGTLTYNECLRQYEFYKIVDPFLAFQEISIFLNNIARPMKPIPEIDDKLLAEAKGFDKWSFRKEPTKRKTK